MKAEITLLHPVRKGKGPTAYSNCRASEEVIISAFNGLAAHVAILDANGYIVCVNTTWRRFAVRNGSYDPKGNIGDNYIDVCRRAAAAGDKLAAEAIEGISAVIARTSPRFAQRYPCHGPDGERWFLMTVTPVETGTGTIIAHDDVTQLIRAENASAASERKLRLSLDAVQMGTFEINLQKEEIVFDLQQAKLLKLPASTRRLTLSELDSMVLDRDARPLKERITAAGERYSDEVRMRLPDCSERWLSFTIAPNPPVWLNPGYYFGICFDVTERKLEEKNRLLSQEVRHRAKNMLSVVLAIARQTPSGGVPSTFVEKFEQRIAGLVASLDLLTNGKELSVSALIQAQLVSFTNSFADQITFKGPGLMMHAACVQALGMALHELATNSVKYGALSRSGGRISIQWDIRDDGHGKQFHMLWSEHGGPEIEAPASRGFGYTVMVSALESSVAGKVQLRYPSSGLVWELTAPLEEIMVLPSQ